MAQGWRGGWLFRCGCVVCCGFEGELEETTVPGHIERLVTGGVTPFTKLVSVVGGVVGGILTSSVVLWRGGSKGRRGGD